MTGARPSAPVGRGEVCLGTSKSGAFPRCGATDCQLRSPYARGEGHLPCSSRPEARDPRPKPPGIWRMSAYQKMGPGLDPGDGTEPDTNANGRTRRSPGDQLWPRLGVTRAGTWVHSAATPVAGFSALCRLGDHSYVVGSTQHSAGHNVDATGPCGRRGGDISGQQPGNLARLDLLSCSRGDHDHERIRGAVSTLSAVTASNLCRGPGP
jgi:hypothetical protein